MRRPCGRRPHETIRPTRHLCDGAGHGTVRYIAPVVVLVADAVVAAGFVGAAAVVAAGVAAFVGAGVAAVVSTGAAAPGFGVVVATGLFSAGFSLQPAITSNAAQTAAPPSFDIS